MTPKTLREQLADSGTIVAPGVYDGWSAGLVEQAGFSCCTMTGYGVSGSAGYPDIGLLTQTEVAERVEALCRVLTIPLIADGDTGYGSPNNVARTVRMFASAGAAGIHLEDQSNPKRCGAMAGKQVVSVEEMQERIAAALAARPNRDFFVVARTDAIAPLGLDEAIERGKKYLEAGADATCALGPRDDEEMQRYGREVPGVKYIAVPGAEISPRWSVAELQRAGYQIIVFPIFLIMVAVPVMRHFLQVLRQTGDVRPMLPQMAKATELNTMLKLQTYLDFENATSEDVSSKGNPSCPT